MIKREEEEFLIESRQYFKNRDRFMSPSNTTHPQNPIKARTSRRERKYDKDSWHGMYAKTTCRELETFETASKIASFIIRILVHMRHGCIIKV